MTEDKQMGALLRLFTSPQALHSIPSGWNAQQDQDPPDLTPGKEESDFQIF